MQKSPAECSAGLFEHHQSSASVLNIGKSISGGDVVNRKLRSYQIFDPFRGIFHTQLFPIKVADVVAGQGLSLGNAVPDIG